MKKWIVVFVLVICHSFFSCYPQEKDPAIWISEEKLIHILADLHIAQGAVKKFLLIERDSMMKTYKNQIATVHGIESNELDSLISVLESHPAYFHDINGKLVEYLEELESKALERKPETSQQEEFDGIKN